MLAAADLSKEKATAKEKCDALIKRLIPKKENKKAPDSTQIHHFHMIESSSDDAWPSWAAEASSPSLEETTVEDDRTFRGGPPECWWEVLDELAHAAEHDEILEGSTLLADFAEQQARDMQLALQQSKVPLSSAMKSLAIASPLRSMQSKVPLPSAMKSLAIASQRRDMSSLTISFDDHADGSISGFDQGTEAQLAASTCLTHPSTEKQASLEEAVAESSFQASFAEQTANEMQQVMSWWKESPLNSELTSQKDCLPMNSLVVSHTETELFFLQKIMFSTSWSSLEMLAPTYACSPLVPTTLSFVDQAKEQAYQVSANLECVDEMRKVLVELKEIDILIDDVNAGTCPNWDTRPIGGDVIMNWKASAWIVWRWVRHFIMRWIWNCMSPDLQLMWVWLVQRPRVAKWLGRFVIVIFMLIFGQLAFSRASICREMKYVEYKEFLQQPYIITHVHNAVTSWKHKHDVGESLMDQMII